MGSEIIFIIPTVIGFAAMATLGGTFVLWLVWMAARRWGPRSLRPGSPRFPVGATGEVWLTSRFNRGGGRLLGARASGEARSSLPTAKLGTYNIPLSFKMFRG